MDATVILLAKFFRAGNSCGHQQDDQPHGSGSTGSSRRRALAEKTSLASLVEARALCGQWRAQNALAHSLEQAVGILARAGIWRVPARHAGARFRRRYDDSPASFGGIRLRRVKPR